MAGPPQASRRTWHDVPFVASQTFADLLNDTLKDRGLSQRALGRELGVRQQTVSKWSRGTVVPRASMLRTIAETLGLDARELGAAIIGERTPPARLDRIIDQLTRFDRDQLAEVEQLVAAVERRSRHDDVDRPLSVGATCRASKV